MPKMHSTHPNYLRVSCHFINLHANIQVIEYGQHRHVADLARILNLP
ncbi:hypothetical protein RintRC_0751 [Richelia intracellularis]|nr:hypothetical protein RintRC_0751 [Richelia intracellularis]